MNNKTYLILCLISVFLIGFIREFIKKCNLEKKKNFSIEFLNILGQYCSSNGRDEEKILWLIHRSTKMQRIMDVWGITDYKPPFANYICKNYQIIVNFITELRKHFDDTILRSSAYQYAQGIQEAITRFIGVLDDLIENQMSKLINPILWFREGVSFLLGSPILILEWFGLVNQKIASKVLGNILFKFISSIIALIGFFGTIMTIVLGWNQFIIILKMFLKKISM